MKIKTVDFLKSATSPTQYPQEFLPEIAFVGRSNVGKSSLINTLLQKKRFAKTSTTPGKTQLINFFKVNRCCIFVDLPGYGYAQVPETVRAKWRPMIEAYLSQREQLKVIVHILDIRVGATNLDFVMREWLDHHQIFTITVFNKADKLTRAKRKETLKRIKGIPSWQEDRAYIFFSTKTGEGRVELWRQIKETLGTQGKKVNL
jgi:GTP-binding protein